MDFFDGILTAWLAFLTWQQFRPAPQAAPAPPPDLRQLVRAAAKARIEAAGGVEAIRARARRQGLK